MGGPTCARPGCGNSKLKGVPMRRCSQCKTLYYCDTQCQRADWVCHKDWCSSQATRLTQARWESGVFTGEFHAWLVAMGPLFFTWICVQGLALFDQPENIHRHFVVLSLRRRLPRACVPLEMFLYEDIL
ncbi:hypothetical protein DFH09DRAFT_1309033 [Mycena vulgaris]|nr:hypothetical protein DFH09DRAFT_1309033 [Mycena vulgaris]